MPLYMISMSYHAVHHQGTPETYRNHGTDGPRLRQEGGHLGRNGFHRTTSNGTMAPMSQMSRL